MKTEPSIRCCGWPGSKHKSNDVDYMPSETARLNGSQAQAFSLRNVHQHPMYGVWCTMIQRCTNPNVKVWRNYGGRGIVVCERWKSFSCFLEDMLPAYQHGLSLDRKDNDGPYSPENCRWETRAAQALNKRTSRLITFRGETMNLISWARRLGITHVALIRRLERWPKDRAMTERPLPWCYDI
jgi:hypothetical protein